MRSRIDPLITERAPWLATTGAVGNASRHLAEKILAYDETLRHAEIVKDMPAQQVFQHMTRCCVRRLDVDGLHNIPASGPALVVANHPTGIADGLFLQAALKRVRSDLFFFANSDILRVLPQMNEMIVPVEWRHERRSRAKTRETLRLTGAALADGRLGVIFPSGRLAKRRGLRLFERDWMPSAAMIARKFDIPVIPVHLEARNSALYYLFDLIHPSLRDITLFYETSNKHRQTCRIAIGAPVDAKSLPVQSQEAIALLRQRTLALAGVPTPSVSLVQTSPLLQGWFRTRPKRSAVGGP